MALACLIYFRTFAANNPPNPYKQLEKASGAVMNNQKVVYGTLPQDSLVKPILVKYVVNETIDVRPIEGHHFNLKAHNNCDMQEPSVLKPEFLQCQFDEAGKKKINLFICDDKESFCKMEKLDVDIVAPNGYQSALKKRVSSNIIYIPKAELKAPPGFIQNKVQYAMDQAKKENKLLFIAFSAQWCPTCNLLDENVFESKKFQEETKDLIKLMVDVDSDISWDLKEKFHIGAYPTTVVTTSTLNEISRVVGYRSPVAMSVWLKEVYQQKDEPIDFVLSKIISMKDVGQSANFKAEYDKKVLRAAQWYLDQDLPQKALNILKNTDAKTGQRLSLQAELSLADKNNDKIQSKKLLSELIQKFSDDVWVSSWELSLTQQDLDRARKLLPLVEKNIQKWSQSDAIESTEFLKSDLYEVMGEVYENLGDNVQSRQSYAACAKDYERLLSQSLIKNPRGANLERSYCLLKSGEQDKALALLENLTQNYKEEFAFNFYYAKALFETGNSKKALDFSKKALRGSYGDNMIRAATLKAQIELAQNDLKSAEETVNATLRKIYLPKTVQIRTHRYVTNLKSVLAKIELQKQAKQDDLKKSE